MNRQIELPRWSRKVRLWLDELPQAEYPSSVLEERVFVPHDRSHMQSIAGPRLAAAEIHIATGVDLYALIGGAASSASHCGTRLQMRIADAVVKADDLVASSYFHEGLPLEYVEGIAIEVARSCLNADILISRAMHHTISSSIMSFRVATRLFCHLLTVAHLDDVKPLALNNIIDSVLS